MAGLLLRSFDAKRFCASRVTIQGEIEVAKDLLTKGPRGTYSIFECHVHSSVHQNKAKNMICGPSIRIGLLCWDLGPIKTRALVQIRRVEANWGGWLAALVVPRAWMGVGLTTTGLRDRDSLPEWLQLGNKGFLVRNMAPTFEACSFESRSLYNHQYHKAAAYYL